MRLRERYERVLDTLEALREGSRTAPVVVEGKRDREALERLGVRGEVVTLNSGTSIFGLCETLAREHEEVIVLTDWDRRGGQLCRLLREGLAANGVRCDVDLRAQLAGLCKKEAKDVESLAPFVERIQQGLARGGAPRVRPQPPFRGP